MAFLEVLERRKSVRRYRLDPVPDDKVMAVVALARTGPSAGGIRAYHIIATDKPVVRPAAPVYLVVCCEPERYEKRYGRRGRDLYAVQDATIAAAYAQLAAVYLGLATVWVGAFRERKVKQMLDLPGDWRVVVVLPMGYAEDA